MISLEWLQFQNTGGNTEVSDYKNHHLMFQAIESKAFVSWNTNCQ